MHPATQRPVLTIALALGLMASSASANPLDETRGATRAPAYRAKIVRLPAATRHLMIGRSWHEGCPVGLGDLRLIKLTYWGFDREAHPGKLVVHRRWAPEVARVFHKLYDARFPIRRMRLVDRYGAVDMRSMKADNTSAFNCRYRNGVCCTWSQHAYGRAIDINPVENPYVGPWGVSPPNGASLRASHADAARHARVPRSRMVGVPRDRVALGRVVGLAHGLPALLCYEPLTASTHAAVSSAFGSTAPPSPGCHSTWSWGPVASPVAPT